MFDALFNKALKAGVEKGEFSQPKGKHQVSLFLMCIPPTSVDVNAMPQLLRWIGLY